MYSLQVLCGFQLAVSDPHDTMSWHQQRQDLIPAFWLKLEDKEPVLLFHPPLENQETKQPHQKLPQVDRPSITWGDVKSSIASAHLHLAQDHGTETPETSLTAISTQLTYNSTLILLLFMLCFSVPIGLACLTTVTPEVEIPLGSPVLLSCFWNCSRPSSWGSTWLFNGKGLGPDWFKVQEQPKVGEKEKPLDLSRGKTETGPEDAGRYSCRLIDNSDDVPHFYIINITVSFSVHSTGLGLQDNLWVYLARSVLNHTSFCVREGNSPTNILANNLVGIGVTLSMFEKETKHSLFQCTNATLTHPIPLLPLSFSLHKNDSFVRFNSSIILPTGWAFLCSNYSYQALPPSYSGLCSIGRVVPALLPPLPSSQRHVHGQHSLPP